MRVNIISGSRADAGLLRPVYEACRGAGINAVCLSALDEVEPCDCVVVLGDRHEILKRVIDYHMRRIPIAHLCGGDVTRGSYDDAFRDCISRMATWHFVSNAAADARLLMMGYRNVHFVGATSIDAIKAHKPIRRIEEPYVIVSYQPETATGENRIEEVFLSLPKDKLIVFFMPNDDTGSTEISEQIRRFSRSGLCRCIVHDYVQHGYYLDLLAYCDEIIGNSSSMFYEAPFLNVKTRVIGRRQLGRVIPEGDGTAGRKIVRILKEWHDSIRCG